AVREYARGKLLPADRAWDRGEISCCAELDELYAMGLMGLRIPEEHGGLDCDMHSYAAIIRELAYASPSVAVTVSVHNMVAESLRQHASPEIRSDILETLAQPGNLAGFAITEPNS